MILLHVIQMSLAITDGVPEQHNEDVTFYADTTAMVAIGQLATLQDIKRQLRTAGEPIIKYHLLHVSDIYMPWFPKNTECLRALNGIDLESQVQQHQDELDSKNSWYNHG